MAKKDLRILGDNGASGNMFDFTCNKNIIISAIDVNCTNQNTSYTIEVYYKTGSYIGYETNSSAWTLASQTNVTSSNAYREPTHVDITDLHLPADNYALYITDASGNGLNYTNGSNYYTDGTISIQTGIGNSYPFSGIFNPRTWNGRIYYEQSLSMNLSTNSASIDPNDDVTIDVEFDATNLNSGIYYSNIIVSSNDPVTPSDTIFCTFTVDGEPEFIVSDDAFDFGSIWISQNSNQSIEISNPGCDTLKVYGISSDRSDFSASLNTFTVVPGQSQFVTLTFAPSHRGEQNAILTIATNAGDSLIYLTGTGLASFVESVNSNTADGYYKNLGVIEFTITFDSPVVVTGTPQLKLNTNPVAYANYSGGSGSNTLTFTYTVGGTDNSNDLDYTSIDDLTLNGGTIQRIDNGYPADLWLPAVGSFANEHNIVIDNTPPTPVISSNSTPVTNNNPIKFIIDFHEAVTGFDMGDIVVGNGTASSFTLISGAKYSIDVTPADRGKVTVDVAADVAMDLAGNNNLVAAQVSRVYDNVQPSVSITSGASNPTNDNPLVVYFQFSEIVNGFTIADIVVSNGSATNMTTLVSHKKYQVEILPITSGIVTVDLPANSVADEGGNGNIAASQFSITCNNISPTVTLSTATSSPNNAATTLVTVQFSEAVTGFDISDLDILNGTASNLQTLTASTKYTVDIAPASDGDVKIDMEANKVQNSGGSGNIKATQLLYVYDHTAPTVALASSSNNPTHANTFSVSIEFNEAVAGFALADITVTNGTAGNLATLIAGKKYTADITPSADGTVSIAVAAAVATDAAGNGNTSSNTISIVSDKTAPTVSLSTGLSEITNKNPFQVTIEFSEAVDGFQLTDFNVANGWAANLVALKAANKYKADIFPNSEGTVTVDIAANTSTDLAGNSCSAATQLSLIYDGTAPTTTISTTSASLTNSTNIGFTIDFSENVSGFSMADITVNNGTASNFVAVSASKYTVDIAPAANGTVTVDVYANTCADAAGNGNKKATQVSINYDSTAPAVAITSLAKNPTNNNPIQIVVKFNEQVSGFTLTDVTVGNGTAGNLVETQAGKQYTLDITPAGNGQVTASIASGAATDLAGNGNTASNAFSTVYDNTRPAASIATSASNPTNAKHFNITVTFNEPVVGFGPSFLFANNATTTNFVEVTTGVQYTMEISPLFDGLVTLYVAANVAKDVAGNGNTASSTITLEYDSQAPVLTGITITGVNANEANFVLDANENGTVYYQVKLQQVTPPNASAIIANTGDSVVVAGTVTLASDMENQVDLTNLETGESYTLYMVTQDALGNKSVVYDVDFETRYVNITEGKGIGMQLYPNPNTGEFFIELGNADLSNAYISITDVAGNIIENVKITEQKQLVKLDNQPQGVYFVQLHLLQGVYTYSFVIK